MLAASEENEQRATAVQNLLNVGFFALSVMNLQLYWLISDVSHDWYTVLTGITEICALIIFIKLVSTCVKYVKLFEFQWAMLFFVLPIDFFAVCIIPGFILAFFLQDDIRNLNFAFVLLFSMAVLAICILIYSLIRFRRKNSEIQNRDGSVPDESLVMLRNLGYRQRQLFYLGNAVTLVLLFIQAVLIFASQNPIIGPILLLICGLVQILLAIFQTILPFRKEINQEIPRFNARHEFHLMQIRTMLPRQILIPLILILNASLDLGTQKTGTSSCLIGTVWSYLFVSSMISNHQIF